MDGEQKKQYGVTHPISEAQPTENDRRLNDELVQVLTEENNFDTPDGQANRSVISTRAV